MNKLFNNPNHRKIKSLLLLFILFFLYVVICASSYVNAVSTDLAESVFRLHVVANSDSEEDQNLKYIVRDELINYMNTIAENANSKEEVIKIANSHLNDFYAIANETIQEQGFHYSVKISIGNFDFPTKTYGDISLPAGSYDALKVEIGDAKGKNWWCVMFPPLCFVDVSSGIVPDNSKETLKENMSEEDYAIISENSGEIKLKFKIIEMFQNAKILTAKNQKLLSI